MSVRLPFPRGATAWLVALVLCPASLFAAEPDGGPRFETHIDPILKAHCVRCHNSEARKAELDLSTPQGLFKGGESGSAIEPGKPDKSLLFEMVHDELMPPEEDRRLAAKDIQTIRLWIEAGAPFVKPVDVRELAAAGEVNNHDIQPLLLLRCAVCHGQRVQEGGLDVRTKASLLKGGKSGPAIVLGKPEESLLVRRIEAGQMPPTKRLRDASVERMSSGEVNKLRRWIELGAPELALEPDVPDGQPDPLVSDADRQHWAFQPPRVVAVPAVKNAARVRNPIDSFVLSRLEEQGLSLTAEADKLALLRRVTFDLTGLPPTPEEVSAFLADEQPQAYERLIDRLLLSPRYGERWGRFWLDLAGYADSEGKRSADPIRPYAYKYRDYVIRAFNADKPYDRFLLEQIAGDELADYENAKQLTPELADNLTATGFLRMAPDGTGSDVVNFVPERLEVVADEIDVFASGVMGLTLKCARCHSHKYDPLPQRDYYRLVDIFKGAFDEHDWLKPSAVPGQTKGNLFGGRTIPLATAEEKQEVAAHNRQLDRQIAQAQAELTKLAEKFRGRHLEEQLAALPADVHEDVKAMLATPAGERNEEQKALAVKFESKLKLDDAALKKNPGYAAEAAKLEKQIVALQGDRWTEPQIRALWDRGKPTPTYIYRRGDYLQPARLVGPGVPSVLTDGKTPLDIQPPWPGSEKTGRRLALAKWLVEPEHPLTARVMVNRIWKHHFGQGIVKSLGNFGRLGTPPTHPELLDWLAREFVGRGWSIKEMHRLMMTSSVYRQGSLPGEAALAHDPENSLLSRMPLRRLDAEEVYDSLLAVSGRLDARPFGRPDPVDVRGDGLVTARATDGGWRRSIYVLQRRKEMLTVLETFDLPQMIPNCLERVQSTVAQQALYLLNNAFVRELADSLADRVAKQAATSEEQVERAYLIALSRPPSETEKKVGREILEQLVHQWSRELGGAAASDDQPATAVAQQKALATYCHTLLNSAAFLYVD